MAEKERIKKLLTPVLSGDLPLPFGIASYSACLPLLPCRAASRIPEGAQSLIVCLFPYFIEALEERNLSRYAVIADYHQVAGDYLARACEVLQAAFPENQFVPFVDNSPIREVSAANLAGLGVIGENGLLINPLYGSYVFIGEIVTDLDIQPDPPSAPSCIQCGKCREACPGKAIRENGSIQLDHCRSHITQKKGSLTEEEQEQIRLGGLVWGCDICNEACPMNRNKLPSPIPEFYQSVIPVMGTETVDQLMKNRAFSYRGKAVLLRNLEILK